MSLRYGSTGRPVHLYQWKGTSRLPGDDRPKQGSAVSRNDEPGFVGQDHRPDAVPQPKFGQEPADMGLDRLVTDDQSVGDLLIGQSLDVKLYRGTPGSLDIGKHPCDYYLVLLNGSDHTRLAAEIGWRWLSAVYLFDTALLLGTLTSRGVAIGTATSLRKGDWAAAELFPTCTLDAAQAPTAEQVRLLSLFSAR